MKIGLITYNEKTEQLVHRINELNNLGPEKRKILNRPDMSQSVPTESLSELITFKSGMVVKILVNAMMYL